MGVETKGFGGLSRKRQAACATDYAQVVGVICSSTNEREFDMVSVKGKWALVTGASRGIEYLTALFVAKEPGLKTKGDVR